MRISYWSSDVCSSVLDDLAARLDARRDRHHWISCLLCREQQRKCFDRVLADARDPQVARTAEQRDRGGFVGKPARIALERAGVEIDAFGLRPHRAREPLAEFGGAGFVGAVEQIKAD